MTYLAYEDSKFLGEPVELYVFRYGVDVYYRYTSSAVDVQLNALTYKATPISRQTIRQAAGESIVYSLGLVVPRDNEVARLFLQQAPKTQLSITILRFHRNDPDLQTQTVFVGKVVGAPLQGDTATLNCLSLTEAMRRKIPWQMYQTQCNWSLFSVGCGVNKAAYQKRITVLSVAENTVQAAEFGVALPGYYAAGFIERDNQETRYIVKHVGDTVWLNAPFVDLEGGELVNALPGCQRTESDCSRKFNNLVQHLGWSRIPTVNPFEKSVYGTTE